MDYCNRQNGFTFTHLERAVVNDNGIASTLGGGEWGEWSVTLHSRPCQLEADVRSLPCCNTGPTISEMCHAFMDHDFFFPFSLHVLTGIDRC
ncbi:hypothetical protein TSMEX_001206 [Taenia solium]|eukprot:TsM_000164200 transcript=TsM_000164200 gene=TsM_000164200